MLRKLGTALSRGLVVLGAVVIAVWIWLPGAWAQTQIVLTNALDYTVANGKSLTGVYECSDGGYIDSSCIIGHFPEVSCPAGYAIQVISSGITPATCIAVGTGTPAGSDTYVQYNASGVFGADQNFTWNYVSSILHLGGAGPGEATFGGDVLANLGTPSNGTFAYCSNCNAGTNPCTTTGSPTGSFAARLNGAWTCFGSSGAGGTVTGTGTTNHLAKWTAASVIGDAVPTDDGTTLTVGALNFSYSQALYATGVRAISTSVSANATDRQIDCTSGSSSDQTYTLPAATGSNRIIDVLKVDGGTKACKIGVPAGAINSGTVMTLPTQWYGETCRDIASGQWYCRGQASLT